MINLNEGHAIEPGSDLHKNLKAGLEAGIGVQDTLESDLLEALKYCWPRVHKHLADGDELERIRVLMAKAGETPNG